MTRSKLLVWANTMKSSASEERREVAGAILDLERLCGSRREALETVLEGFERWHANVEVILKQAISRGEQ